MIVLLPDKIEFKDWDEFLHWLSENPNTSKKDLTVILKEDK